jgi:hypothetical protein
MGRGAQAALSVERTASIRRVISRGWRRVDRALLGAPKRGLTPVSSSSLSRRCPRATAGPHPQVRLRARDDPREEAPDLGDQVQRHLDLDAVLGRARQGYGGEIPAGAHRPRTSVGTKPVQRSSKRSRKCCRKARRHPTSARLRLRTSVRR